MRFFKPGFAKILLTPFVAFSLQIGISSLLEDYLSVSIFDDLGWYVTIVEILIAYCISCGIWEYGKKYPRVRIVIITLLISISSFFFISLAISFFSLCLTDLGLPCIADKPCTPPQSQACPQIPLLQFLPFVSIGIPLLVLIIGTILFIKASKKL